MPSSDDKLLYSEDAATNEEAAIVVAPTLTTNSNALSDTPALSDLTLVTNTNALSYTPSSVDPATKVLQ